MTKEQADAKLTLLAPYLTATVSTSYEMVDEAPYLTFEYGLTGGGTGSISIPISPSEVNINDLVNNLPMANSNRLAALGVMLAPPLV